jgi:GNAT superfamily N-acetyltransferase
VKQADARAKKHFEICQLREQDLDFVFQMVRTEQWNVSKEDLSRLLDYEPEGCFMALVEGAPAGHVFSVSYGKLGWIGMLIVERRHRMMGVGEFLMLHAKRYLKSIGVEMIKLDAVPEISELYRKIGFVDEYYSLRFQGYSKHVYPMQGQSVSSLHEKMIGRIAEFDARYFGGKREQVLMKLYKAFPDLCFVATSKSGVTGYIMCRKGEWGYNLGPWVVTPGNHIVAAGLLAVCLKQIDPNEPVYIGVPEINKFAQRILQRFGLSRYSRAIRMSFGQRPQVENAEGIFAIGGPMKG